MRKILLIMAISMIVLFQFSFIVLPQINTANGAVDCQTYCADPAHETPPAGQICICPTSHKSLEDMIKSLTDWIFWLAMAGVSLMIVVGGALIMTSGGDPKKRGAGINIIKWTIVGLAVILFSKGIASMIKFVFQ